jgi:hypothetical protein
MSKQSDRIAAYVEDFKSMMRELDKKHLTEAHIGMIDYDEAGLHVTFMPNEDCKRNFDALIDTVALYHKVLQ